jgi:nucleolar protein 14
MLLEFSKEARRVVPEALGFLAGVIRLYSPNPGQFAVPSLEAAYNLPSIQQLREGISGTKLAGGILPSLSLENTFIMEPSPEVSASILSASLHLIEKCTEALKGSFELSAETELMYEVSESLLSLRPKRFPEALQKKVASTAAMIAKACPSSNRKPLRRRAGASIVETAVKSLAPQMQDPTKYSMSKDKGKKAAQAAIDRTRREYKREHKAISRELRLDANFIESERRRDQEKKDAKSRAKRQKNFAWLEGEQASMNQQVRLGGGLLKGGGTGVARAKAASGKLGIKKGGKF